MATSARRSALSGQFASPSVRYLVDNSVWSRLSTNPEVVAGLKSIVNSARPDDVLICPPVAVEVGFSARSGSDHSALMDRLTAFLQCAEHPTSEEAMAIQNRLWNGGLLRAAGAMDTLIAAYAIKNGATVLHYDRDFEHIGAVMPEFRHRWIVPRGSID
jgi:predicted nucleic acid-binding protein